MEFLIWAALLGLIPGAIAKSKGYSFGLWWFFGAALFIIALPMSLFLKKNTAALEAEAVRSGDSKKCPHCAELIRKEANVCRFCGRDLVVKQAAAAPSSGVVLHEDFAKCASCGKFYDRTQSRKFCGNCGTPVPA